MNGVPVDVAKVIEAIVTQIRLEDGCTQAVALAGLVESAARAWMANELSDEDAEACWEKAIALAEHATPANPAIDEDGLQLIAVPLLPVEVSSFAQELSLAITHEVRSHRLKMPEALTGAIMLAVSIASTESRPDLRSRVIAGTRDRFFRALDRPRAEALGQAIRNEFG